MERRNMEIIGRTLSRSPGAAILLFLVWGCSLFAGPLTTDKIELVEEGMSSESLSAKVGRKPGEVFTVVDPQDGSKYQVEIFPMQTGTTVLLLWTGSYLQSTRVPLTEDYLFLFRDDSLIFWGFLGQHLESYEDPIGRLYPIIEEHLEK